MKVGLSKQLLAVLYQCVIEKMERLKRTDSPVIGDQLQELEIKLSVLLKK